MLDLDTLAEKCARALNQTAAEWKSVVWSPAFQKLSQSMSDGEVESLLSSCGAPSRLETVLRFLDEHPERGSHSPFVILLKEAGHAGLGLREWIDSLPSGLGFRS